MADALKQFYIGQPSTSSATLFTQPTTSAGSPTAIVRNIHICNTTNAAASISLAIGAAADASPGTGNIYKLFSIPAYGVHIANVNIVLTSAQTFTAKQETSAALTLTVSGVTL